MPAVRPYRKLELAGANDAIVGVRGEHDATADVHLPPQGQPVIARMIPIQWREESHGLAAVHDLDEQVGELERVRLELRWGQRSNVDWHAAVSDARIAGGEHDAWPLGVNHFRDDNQHPRRARMEPCAPHSIYTCFAPSPDSKTEAQAESGQF